MTSVFVLAELNVPLNNFLINLKCSRITELNWKQQNASFGANAVSLSLKFLTKNEFWETICLRWVVTLQNKRQKDNFRKTNKVKRQSSYIKDVLQKFMPVYVYYHL